MPQITFVSNNNMQVQAPDDSNLLRVSLREKGGIPFKCGGGICGTVTWLKNPDSPGKVGQQVFFGMKPSGAGSWSGSAFNPEDGKTYSGSATVSGASLTTKGCALGGLVCKTVTWSRM